MAKRRVVTVRHALATKAKRFPAAKKPGAKPKKAMSVVEAKATGAPIRSGKIIKPRQPRAYTPTV